MRTYRMRFALDDFGNGVPPDFPGRRDRTE
jgi:hypothetical protein